MRLIRSLAFTFLYGYVLMYFSELMFWSKARAEDSLINWLQTWVAYSLVTYIFLSCIKFFRVRSIWALFLCGAIFGWLLEGVVVQTMYNDFPLNISFTGLAWHAILSVWLGWFWLQQALSTGSIKKVFLGSCAIGVFWAGWSLSWWFEEPGNITPLIDLSIFITVSTLIMAVFLWTANRLNPSSFSLSKPVLIVLGFVFVLYFVFVSVPAAPSAPLILIPALALVTFGLYCNRKQEGALTVLDDISGRVESVNFLGLAGIPAAGILVYAAAMVVKIPVPTNWWVYLITMPAGFILLVVSLVQILTKKDDKKLRSGS